MGHFTEETLGKFNEMCADGVDFGEGPIYDFARCITPSGEVYGISDDEQCEVGRKIPDKKANEKESNATQMAKLKKAFIKKIGREMKPEELKKAAKLIDSTRGPKKKSK